MQFNKVLKGLIIALPLVTMVACKSGPTAEELEAQKNAQAQAQAEAERLAAEARANQVQTGTVEPMLSPAEKMKMEMQALMSEQTVYFDFDRSTVNADFYAILDKHAAFLAKNPGQSVVIEGHCDSRGTPEYNIALGELRAKSVQTYLLNAGVSTSQMTVVSYGEEKPAVNGSTESAFAKNRRGVLVYQ
ncbi:MAG: peptidoglycan-associated lipoprotein Pal [Paraglaciecola sp.]|nr:peptidoglycan-associated lipoprotein Pal [Paraglaciecola sp.]NCT46425.1 peptidoglycan-associated lipoprotein Pal [Paraglaciecola sp.]